jgi:hypothetical protein
MVVIHEYTSTPISTAASDQYTLLTKQGATTKGGTFVLRAMLAPGLSVDVIKAKLQAELKVMRKHTHEGAVFPKSLLKTIQDVFQKKYVPLPKA